MFERNKERNHYKKTLTLHKRIVKNTVEKNEKFIL